MGYTHRLVGNLEARTVRICQSRPSDKEGPSSCWSSMSVSIARNMPSQLPTRFAVSSLLFKLGQRVLQLVCRFSKCSS